MSDPAKYRSKEELNAYKLNDPIAIASKEIIKKKIFNQKKLDDINKRIIDEIKDAAEFALNSAHPKDSELFTDVYI